MDAVGGLFSSVAEAPATWQREETTWQSRRLTAAACPCGRRIRATASTLSLAPITCRACQGDFQAGTARPSR